MNLRYRIGSAALLALLVGTFALKADDRVEYKDAKDRTKTIVVTGQIVDDGFTTLKLKTTAGGKEVAIPVADVVRLNFQLPPAVTVEAGPVLSAEDKGEYTKAIDGYKAILPKMAGSDKAKRHVEFKIATLTAALAAEQATQVTPAIDLLKKFLATNTTTWHTAVAARQLINLQVKANDAGGALATADAWAKIDKLPKEAKLEADLAKVDILFQSKKLPETKTKIAEVLKTVAPTDPAKLRLDMYTLATEAMEANTSAADAAKKIEDAIAKANDPTIKAAGYIILGDTYLNKNQPRDAMYSYLWVDVVYNTDRAEQSRALERLVRIFELDSMKDAERSKLFRDKLAKLR
jgi:hypothetical protein